MNTGLSTRRGGRGPVCGSDSARISVLARLAAAWRALRHGPPPTSPPSDVTVSRAELDEAIALALSVTPLGADWAALATTPELELVENTVRLAVDARRQEWAALEAGRWPC